MTTEERFWEKVERGSPSECWEWTAGCFTTGYGCFWYKGRNRPASRVAWRLTYGDIPDGLCVLHHCDKPECVNPSHLWLGTNADNIADRNRKKRQARGERVGTARLTRREVREIYRTPGSHKGVAEEYGVSLNAVREIRIGKTWRHVTSALTTDEEGDWRQRFEAARKRNPSIYRAKDARATTDEEC